MTALRVGVPGPLRKAASLRTLFCGVPGVRQGVKAGGVLEVAMEDLVRGVDGRLARGDWRMKPALFSWAKRRRDIAAKTRSSVGCIFV